MESHYLSTITKLESEEVILKMQDTTELNFTTHKSVKGLGYLTKSKCSGLMVHSTLAVTKDGLPIGLLNQKVWSRDMSDHGKKKDRRKKPIEEKESYKWLESLKETEEMFLNSQIQVMIGDRESDIYEFFSMDRKRNSHFLIRACQDRIVDHIEHNLFTLLNKLEPQGFIKLEVPRNKLNKERIADIAVKYEKVKFKKPVHARKDIPEVEQNVILVEELNAPDGIESIKWILLTTLEIDCIETALKYVNWYSYRWLIERFHYTLKSGCQIEKHQLDSADKLIKALSVYSIIACTLLNLTYLSRKTPNESCDIILEKKEWQTLYSFVHKSENIPEEVPSLNDVTVWIARLGGFLARKGDGFPGVKTLWKGYRRFQEILETIDFISSFKNRPGFLTT